MRHALYYIANPDFDSTPQIEKAAYERHKKVWGDWVEVIDMMIAEGDRVMVHWVGHGVQEGEYFGVPATNKQVSLSGSIFFALQMAGLQTFIR